MAGPSPPPLSHLTEINQPDMKKPRTNGQSGASLCMPRTFGGDRCRTANKPQAAVRFERTFAFLAIRSFDAKRTSRLEFRLLTADISLGFGCDNLL